VARARVYIFCACGGRGKSVRDLHMFGAVRKESKRHKAKGWDSMTIGRELFAVHGQGRPLWGRNDKEEPGFRRKRGRASWDREQ